MATKQEQLEAIYESYVNGQLKQMAAQIDAYGLYDVWDDIYSYLFSIRKTLEYGDELADMTLDIVIKYHRIKYR